MILRLHQVLCLVNSIFKTVFSITNLYKKFTASDNSKNVFGLVQMAAAVDCISTHITYATRITCKTSTEVPCVP